MLSFPPFFITKETPLTAEKGREEDEEEEEPPLLMFAAGGGGGGPGGQALGGDFGKEGQTTDSTEGPEISPGTGQALG